MTSTEFKSHLQLFGSPLNTKIRSEFDSLSNLMQNPYLELKVWLKFEMQELVAFSEGVSKIKQLEKQYLSETDTYRSDLLKLSRL